MSAEQLKAIQDEMGQAWTEMQARMDSFDPIDKAAVDAINTNITELREQQDKLAASMKRQRLVEQAADDIEREDDPEKVLQRQAFEKFLRHGMTETGRAQMSAEELRALADSSDSDGGYVAPAVLEAGIIRNMHELAAIRPHANTGNTSGSSVEFPKMNQIAFSWGQAGVAVTEATLATGLERMPIEELTGLYRVANSTLEDDDANLLAELSVMYGEGIAEEEDKQFATGDGVKKPQGIFSDARVQANYTPTGVAAALSDASNPLYDTLVDVVHALKMTYRANARWAMNSATEGVVRKMKDDDNRPIWQMPVSAGTPPALLGYPIIHPENSPDVAANAFPIVFGDLRRGYRIRDRRGMTVQRLVERYAEYRQTGFLVTKRLGAQTVLPEAFRCVKVATS